MFRKISINLGFYLIEAFLINKINVLPLRQFFKNQIDPAKKIADLLTDSNPDNNAQIIEFWNANKFQIIESNIEVAKAVIKEKVKDEKLSQLLIDLLDNIDDELGNIPA